MTRKDYIALANALNNAKPRENSGCYAPDPNATARMAWLAAVCGVSDALTKDNPRFDSDMFLMACESGLRVRLNGTSDLPR
jgi:hypothetical protein